MTAAQIHKQTSNKATTEPASTLLLLRYVDAEVQHVSIIVDIYSVYMLIYTPYIYIGRFSEMDENPDGPNKSERSQCPDGPRQLRHGGRTLAVPGTSALDLALLSEREALTRYRLLRTHLASWNARMPWRGP